MLFFQLPQFAVMSVPELANICASLELLTDPMALGRVGVRSMSHQAKVETGKGRPPPEGSSAWKQQHQANLHGPNLAQHQALVHHWLQAEAQGWSGKPGDKPSFAGAHRLYEQHMQTTGSKTMSIGSFSRIARDVVHQPQHQDLASRFPMVKPK